MVQLVRERRRRADPLDRLVAKVGEHSAGGCWPWLGKPDTRGYGSFYLGDRVIGAHVASHILFLGAVPEGMVVGHVCHDEDLSCPGGACAHRMCVNPGHLRAMPQTENSGSGRASYLGRSDGLCRDHLHDITKPENIYTRRNGHRTCRSCKNEKDRRRKGAN